MILLKSLEAANENMTAVYLTVCFRVDSTLVLTFAISTILVTDLRERLLNATQG